MASLSPKRISFANSPPVQRVADSLPEGQSLAARMATIAERYAIICEHPPSVTEDERQIMRGLLKGKTVNRGLVQDLPNLLRDTLPTCASVAEIQATEALSERIALLSLGERIALIEDVERQGGTFAPPLTHSTGAL